MVYGEYRRVEVDGITALFGVDECLSWCISESEVCLSRAHLMVPWCAISLYELHLRRALYSLCLQSYRRGESGKGLILELKLLAVVEVHHVDVTCLERHEEIILVREEIFV